MTTIDGLTPGTWQLDAAHSEASFTVRHAGISKVRGTFGTIDASFEAGETLEASSVRGSADIDSINTGNADRDGHLKSGEFFDAESFPQITFSSTEIETDGEDLTVRGELTMHGETRPVEFTGELGGVAKDAFGQVRLGVSVQTTISRKEFGITWNAALEAGGVMVSDKVKINIDAEFTAPAN